MAQEIPSPIVVGIGASAGGLAALRKFFGGTPSDTGLAFVVVVHLSPEHESHLTELLQPHSAMPVMQVTATIPLEANHVYVIPPGQNLGTIDSHLRLVEMEPERKHRAPIDRFLETLAGSHGRASVGVILSGTGSDGAAGLKLIKDAGGLTVVQDPNEAEYDGMPQSAIATGFVDYILPLSEITGQIVRFTNTDPRVPIPGEEDELSSDNQQILQKIFAQVRVRTGHDFGRYKDSTALRRIRRRMQLRQLLDLPDYLRVLRESAEENHALVDDLLITVTSFFRDPEVFVKLETEVYPKVFEKKDRNDRVRAWSVGCATGEEAYSLAISLLEYSSRIDNPPQIQVFASDLHEASLLRAREGFYPESIEAHVSPDRLKRFFTVEAGGYRVRKEVRELVVFASHNFLKDPPFSQIDFLSCRNVMIYLKRDIQEDVIQLFHYSLCPDGFLLLGSSETVERSELFRLEDKKHCIYRRRSLATKEPRLPVFPVSQFRILPAIVSKAPQTGTSHGVLHQRMVERYAPPSVLLDQEYNIVHLSENAGMYLQQPGGEPTYNIFKRVTEELRVELRATLHAAKEAGGRARSKALSVMVRGEKCQIIMQARPADDPELEGYWLLIFDDLAGVAAEQDLSSSYVTSNELAAEAEIAKKRLQAVIEEYETTQEEMRAGNEELQSTNEELRSTMEELETSKEELQSMNEELQTLNQENKHKVAELSQLSGDLQNLLTATDIATLFLDRSLRIMRFTPRVGELFSIRATDRGRPLADLTNRLGYADLFDDAQHVLARLVPVERELRAENMRSYLTRLLPYRSADDRIDGVVITFVDVTELQEAERARRRSEEHLSQELAAIRCLHQMTVRVSAGTDRNDALLSIALSIEEADRADGGCVHVVNDAGELELVAHHDLDPELVRRLRLLGADDQTTCSVALRSGKYAQEGDISKVDGSDGSYRDLVGSADVSAMHSAPIMSGEAPIGILTTVFREPRTFTERDGQLFTIFALQAATLLERFRGDAAVRQANEDLKQINQELESFAYVAGHDLQEPLRMVNTHTQLLLQREGFQNDPNAVRYAAVINSGVKRMEALIKGLLAYSRLVHSDTVSQPVDLQAVVERELGFFDSELKETRAKVTYEGLPRVLGDEQQLGVVVQNLLSNALKYRNVEDIPRIHISADCKDGYWTTRIQDNGIGFKPEHNERIFGLFKRLHSSAYAGTGLGLAICRRAVERCGGEMWAWSAGEGQGSTFSFRLREAK